MAVLQVVPVSRLSSDFEIAEHGARVGLIDFARFREAAELTAEGCAYRASRQGRARSAFVLERDGLVVASADKPSGWRRLFSVRWEDRTYELAPESAWRRGYALRSGERVLGTIRPAGWATRKAVADLPDDLPLAVRMFVTWIVLTMWRRAA